jgi:VanZ family protein
VTRWRWWLWGGYVTTWTVALVMPVPPHPFPAAGDQEATLKFVVAKALHVGAYVVMTLLTAWLRAPAANRGLLMFLLMAHGTATELIQANLSYREGTLRDVGFDHLGVLIGLILSWRWWTQNDSR